MAETEDACAQVVIDFVETVRDRQVNVVAFARTLTAIGGAARAGERALRIAMERYAHDAIRRVESFFDTRGVPTVDVDEEDAPVALELRRGRTEELQNCEHGVVLRRV